MNKLPTTHWLPILWLPRQVLALVAGKAHGWRTVCALITVTSLNSEAAPDLSERAGVRGTLSLAVFLPA